MVATRLRCRMLSPAASVPSAGPLCVATPEDLPPRIADRYLALKAAGRL